MTNFRQYTNTAFDFFRNILDMVFPSKIAVNIDPKIPDALYSKLVQSNQTITDPKEIATAFNKFFSSIDSTWL